MIHRIEAAQRPPEAKPEGFHLPKSYYQSSAQVSLFDPAPCAVCAQPVVPHWLPNYTPPVWVATHGPKCGSPIYAATREIVVGEWNAAQAS